MPHGASIEEDVACMLRDRIIEPSNSPWSRLIVIVPKADKCLRICYDLHSLISITEIGYSMSRVEPEREARWSPFHINFGFDQGLLASSTHNQPKIKANGHWQFQVLPFGLHGAPSIIQWLIDVVLWYLYL